MIKHTLLLIIVFLSVTAYAQVPRFEKHQVGTTGVSLYCPATPEFDLSYSEDSSAVYTTDMEVDSFYFSAIVVEFSAAIGDDKTANEELLITYLDFLQNQFAITGNAGYGKGHTLEQYPDVVGVIDYWQDADSTQYSITGWINSKYLVVLLIYGPSTYPIYNVAELYFKGVRFESN